MGHIAFKRGAVRGIRKIPDIIVPVAVVFSVAVCPTMAHAYMGQALVDTAAMYILAPLAFLMVIITVVGAFFAPGMAKQAGYVCIIATVLFVLIKIGNVIINAFQSSAS